MKTALFVLGGIFIMSGIFQFYGISDLEAMSNTFMGSVAKLEIEKKQEFGFILIAVGGMLLVAGAKIDSDETSKSDPNNPNG